MMTELATFVAVLGTVGSWMMVIVTFQYLLLAICAWREVQ
jgi:hypothetical protein